MFDSHYPIEHKLSVVRTLLDRKNKIVTDEADKLAEENHVKSVLRTCKYPDWAIERVEKQLSDKQQGLTKPKSKNNTNGQTRGMTVLPYVSGVTERVRRVMKNHGIETPARLHHT